MHFNALFEVVPFLAFHHRRALLTAKVSVSRSMKLWMLSRRSEKSWMPKPSDWSSVADGDGEMSPGATTHMSPCCRNCQIIFRSHLDQTSNISICQPECATWAMLSWPPVAGWCLTFPYHSTRDIFSKLLSWVPHAWQFNPRNFQFLSRRIHYSSRLFANFGRQKNTYNVYN